ncbi:MAG: type 1 glutamine amidotransferase [Verrucomicrobiota bacterium]
MKRVLFVQHGEVDKPGLLARALEESGVELVVAHPYAGGELPSDLRKFSGLALGGGGQSAWEIGEHPYLECEAELVRAALSEEKPVLGLCLGGQIIARALGAEVRRAPAKEIGFYPVTMKAAAKDDPLARIFPEKFGAAHWHGDVFDLPNGAKGLASTEATANQMFRFGRACYGFQFHPEMTAVLFGELVRDEMEWFRTEGLDGDSLVKEAGEVLPLLESSAIAFFKGWAGLL